MQHLRALNLHATGIASRQTRKSNRTRASWLLLTACCVIVIILNSSTSVDGGLFSKASSLGRIWNKQSDGSKQESADDGRQSSYAAGSRQKLRNSLTRVFQKGNSGKERPSTSNHYEMAPSYPEQQQQSFYGNPREGHFVDRPDGDQLRAYGNYGDDYGARAPLDSQQPRAVPMPMAGPPQPTRLSHADWNQPRIPTINELLPKKFASLMGDSLKMEQDRQQAPPSPSRQMMARDDSFERRPPPQAHEMMAASNGRERDFHRFNKDQQPADHEHRMRATTDHNRPPFDGTHKRVLPPDSERTESLRENDSPRDDSGGRRNVANLGPQRSSQEEEHRGEKSARDGGDRRPAMEEPTLSAISGEPKATSSQPAAGTDPTGRVEPKVSKMDEPTAEVADHSKKAATTEAPSDLVREKEVSREEAAAEAKSDEAPKEPAAADYPAGAAAGQVGSESKAKVVGSTRDSATSAESASSESDQVTTPRPAASDDEKPTKQEVNDRDHGAPASDENDDGEKRKPTNDENSKDSEPIESRKLLDESTTTDDDDDDDSWDELLKQWDDDDDDDDETSAAGNQGATVDEESRKNVMSGSGGDLKLAKEAAPSSSWPELKEDSEQQQPQPQVQKKLPVIDLNLPPPVEDEDEEEEVGVDLRARDESAAGTNHGDPASGSQQPANDDDDDDDDDDEFGPDYWERMMAEEEQEEEEESFKKSLGDNSASSTGRSETIDPPAGKSDSSATRLDRSERRGQKRALELDELENEDFGSKWGARRAAAALPASKEFGEPARDASSWPKLELSGDYQIGSDDDDDDDADRGRGRAAGAKDSKRGKQKQAARNAKKSANRGDGMRATAKDGGARRASTPFNNNNDNDDDNPAEEFDF